MDDKEKTRLLYREVEGLVKKERELRRKYGMGERYKAIASRLEALFNYVHQAVSLPKQDEAPKRAAPVLSPEERFVFVYLFNAKGKTLSRWESMLSPRLLYEYSVNRPIYAEQKQVEAYIRSRSDGEEHGFLMMKVLNSDIVDDNESSRYQDALGISLLRLKEGVLKEHNLIYFFHQSLRYIFSHGHLVLDQES